jgi:hypothetical protein
MLLLEYEQARDLRQRFPLKDSRRCHSSKYDENNVKLQRQKFQALYFLYYQTFNIITEINQGILE